MFAAVLDGGTVVVIVKLALIDPAGTTTFGTVATPVLLRVTVAPPAGAAPDSVTVPVDEFPPTTGFGLNEMFCAKGGGTPQTPGVAVPPQISGDVQLPQAIQLPQPSGIAPQFFPCAAHVVGVHGPHTFGTPPPPQLCGAVQLPQFKVCPQPSEIVPQFLPNAAQLIGAQTGGARTRRYAESAPVVRFSAWPTITEPSAETALANTNCQPFVFTI
jgi:hypothetical protein